MEPRNTRTTRKQNGLEEKIREKAVSREKAQKAQKKGSFALPETFTEWVTTVSTPSLSFCAFCAFSWPIAVRLLRHALFLGQVKIFPAPDFGGSLVQVTGFGLVIVFGETPFLSAA